jgi:molecular chaperone DnaJ
MNLQKNYYQILGVNPNSDQKTIKKAYYGLSNIHHPDKGGSSELFSEISEAYEILCSESRKDYDTRSKFGNSYNEYFELLDVKVDYDFHKEKTNLDNFKRNEVNDIWISVDDTFDGTVEYERWVKCRDCDGSGRDFSSKIVIRDVNGNITKTFDADDGCDFCDGTGKYMNQDCHFCSGKGKVGINPCKKCHGERRILGKQKISKLKLTGDETKIASMGNYSKTTTGVTGFLILKKSSKTSHQS